MNNWNGDRTPADLAQVEQRLREERVTATELELDSIKLRARRQGAQAAPQMMMKGNWMKSRLALTLMIVTGLMMSTTGATLAVQGSSGNGNAATNQYNSVTPGPKDDYKGQDDSGDQGEGQTLGANEDDSAPAPAAGSVSPSTEQAEVADDNGGNSLPFTGFFAIPLLIGGVALLSTGTVMRLRTRSKD
ncbi:MAG TPA: hypothetical protein VEQ61_06695 [Thermoleophilaceae bacterium]|nr:hypothetical protein [Thermoleophilaceae bacterium]